jgi:hypothetical protein
MLYHEIIPQIVVATKKVNQEIPLIPKQNIHGVAINKPHQPEKQNQINQCKDYQMFGV